MHTNLTPAQRTARLLDAMTTAEKFEQLVGAPGIVPELPQCNGSRHVPGIPRLAIPTLRITNGPVGIGENDCRPQAPATALPSGMAVAASFDPAVATQFGDVIGVEARALALHVVEGPGLNLARVPQGGRNFEYFGEDPFLTGTMAVAEIRAIQGHGVIAMAKHFIANEQETNRSHGERDGRRSSAPRVVPAAVRDGGEGRQGRRGDVLVQFRQRTSRVRGPPPPHRCPAGPVGIQRLRAVGLLRCPQYGADTARRHGSRDAGISQRQSAAARGSRPRNCRRRSTRTRSPWPNIDTALARRYRQMFRARHLRSGDRADANRHGTRRR